MQSEPTVKSDTRHFQYAACLPERFATTSSLRTLVMLIVVAIATPSCALFDPYVEPEAGLCLNSAENPTLAEAVTCAESWKDEYRGALSTQANTNSYVGVSLIVLSAAALGMGITGGHQDSIAWIGVTGAAAYGATNWLTSKPRERAYIAGLKAMSCASGVVQPLYYLNSPVPTVDERLRRLETQADPAKVDSNNSVETRVGNLEKELLGAGYTPADPSVHSRLTKMEMNMGLADPIRFDTRLNKL